MKKLVATVACLAIWGCGSSTPPAAGTTAAAPTTAKPAFGAWGVDLTSLDPGVKPGDDFFFHVNGKWFATAEIPADRTSTARFRTCVS